MKVHCIFQGDEEQFLLPLEREKTSMVYLTFIRIRCRLRSACPINKSINSPWCCLVVAAQPWCVTLGDIHGLLPVTSAHCGEPAPSWTAPAETVQCIYTGTQTIPIQVHRWYRSINQSINQSNKFFRLAKIVELLLGPLETVSWCPASSQEKTSWTGVSWGGDEMWPMILLMSSTETALIHWYRSVTSDGPIYVSSTLKTHQSLSAHHSVQPVSITTAVDTHTHTGLSLTTFN